MKIRTLIRDGVVPEVLEITQGLVHLICGPNASGKTEWAETARNFVLTEAPGIVSAIATGGVRWADLNPTEKTQVVAACVPISDEGEQVCALALEILRTKQLIKETEDAVAALPKASVRNVQIRLRINTLRVQLAEHADTIRWAREAAEIMGCPNCDAMLVMRDGDLAPAPADAGDLNPPVDKLEAARTEAARLQGEIDALDKEHAEKVATLSRAASAKPVIAKYQGMLEELTKQYELLPAVLRTKYAIGAWNASVMDFNQALGVLLDGGAGWRGPRLSSNADLYWQGEGKYPPKPYEALPKSFRWLADAFLAVTVATLTKLNVVVLDDMDSLGIEQRSHFLQWLSALPWAEEPGTIIVCCTMARPPTSAQTFGATVHWLGGAT